MLGRAGGREQLGVSVRLRGVSRAPPPLLAPRPAPSPERLVSVRGASQREGSVDIMKIIMISKAMIFMMSHRLS